MWRDIKEYEGLYEINENAVVRRVEGKGIDGRKVTTHVVVSSKTRKGTRYIALWKDGNRKTFMLNKIYAEAFYMSENEACRRLYKGFIGDGQAVQNVKDILLRNLSDLEKEDGVQETAWSGESDDTGNALNDTLTASLTAYIEDLDFTRKEQREFEEAYELDNKIHGVAVADLTEDDIRDLKHTYGETEEVLRREIGYYVYQNDFDKAKDIIFIFSGIWTNNSYFFP